MLSTFYHPHIIEAGCDEAGRGCYAGPVFAAAVILPPHQNHSLLRDSKKLNSKQRLELKNWIEEHAIAFAVASCSVEEIDELNILKASFKAMHKAIAQLVPAPQHLLIDGNRFISYPSIEHTCIIKGDDLYTSIAAASILAKTARDAFMETIHYQYPEYDWMNNKGYGTAKHRAAIEQFGLTPLHRKSFNIVPKQINLF